MPAFGKEFSKGRTNIVRCSVHSLERIALNQCERKFARVLTDNIFGNMQKEILSELLAVGKIILRQDLPIGVYFGCNFTLDYNPQ